jgi:signal transduction histidine kinase/CheY-like chemotaxis protein
MNSATGSTAFWFFIWAGFRAEDHPPWPLKINPPEANPLTNHSPKQERLARERKGRFTSVRTQLVASVFLWISPALVLTFIVNQGWFWQFAPEWMKQYALSVPWGSFLVGLMALAAAWYGGEHFILRQVQALTRAVLRLAGGDLEARTGLKRAEGEIGQLAAKFDEMASALQQRQKERDEADQKLLNRAMQQTAVSAVGQCALTNRNLEVIYEQAVYRVAEMFGVEYAMLFQRMPTGTLHPLAVYGLAANDTGKTVSLSHRRSQMSWTAETGEVSVVNDWSTETNFGRSPLLDDLGVVSGVAVAIPTRQKPFGVLAAHTTHRREFSPDDIQFLLAVANVVGMATERIRAEDSTEKLAAFVKENPNAALELAGDGAVNYFNDAAGKLTQSLGLQKPRQLLPEGFPAMIRESLISGQSQTGITSSVNGHTLSWTIQPLPANGVVHCYGEDVTTRLSLEAQLLQSEKMKTFGQFAAGIAHDFNNMLTIIQGHTGKLLENESLSPETRESLMQVYSAGDRAARLTRQLLLTSRKNVIQAKLLDLRDVVGNISQMLQRLVGETIELRFQSPQTLPLVNADPSMIEQVVMNLASNARDAMPNGGFLTIQISETFVSEVQAALQPEASPGQFVKLQVTDNGCGMDDATRARIFEPFFTTKDIGKGTGLGLATVFNIARQHGGWIEVHSALERGSTFTLFLPASSETIAQSHPMPPPANDVIVGGNETILVVEDEEMLREMACEILESSGYRILMASSGKQALEVWRQHRDQIDLVLSDMVMPEGMSGTDLAGQLVAENPSLKIVFMSGYTDHEMSPELLQHLNATFIAKPYGHVELARLIRQSLDRPACAAGLATSGKNS